MAASRFRPRPPAPLRMRDDGGMTALLLVFHLLGFTTISDKILEHQEPLRPSCNQVTVIELVLSRTRPRGSRQHPKYYIVHSLEIVHSMYVLYPY